MKSPNETFAVLAPNLVVSGNLVSEGNIHVDGTVEGDVQTVHLTIGASGVVKGRVFGREVKISGRVVQVRSLLVSWFWRNRLLLRVISITSRSLLLGARE